MSVILLILKIAGIILLSLVGLLLFLLLLVLFVPIRYEIKGEITEVIKVSGRLSWLLRIVSFKFLYEDEVFSQGIRIFGIRVKKKKDTVPQEEVLRQGARLCEAVEKEEEAGKSGDTESKSSMEQRDSEEGSERTPEESESGAERTGDRPGSGDCTAEDRADDEPEERAGDGKADAQEKRQRAGDGESSESEKPQNPQAAEEHVLKNRKTAGRKKKRKKKDIKSIFRRLKESVFNLREKITDIKTMITDETNRNTVILAWTELKYLLSHFRFRRVKTALSFSLGDPAWTGQVLGIFCMMPILYRYQFAIVPDFESERIYVKGTFDIAGRVRISHLLVSFVRLWKVKEFRVFVKRMLK